MARRRREANIEAAALRAIKKHWPTAEVRKMNGYGHRSWPDRLVVLPGGASVWIEFKREGEDPTPDQAHLHRRLSALGQHVVVCWNRDCAIAACASAMMIRRARL